MFLSFISFQVQPAPRIRMEPMIHPITIHKSLKVIDSGLETKANPRPQKHGINNSQAPTGRSSLLNFKNGLLHDGQLESTQLDLFASSSCSEIRKFFSVLFMFREPKMKKKLIKVRLYVDIDLSTHSIIELSSKQVKYLFDVMRLDLGDQIFLIDGKTGEYVGEISKRNKNNATLVTVRKIRDMIFPPDLWLFFSPLKKTRTDLIVEKATELGVRRICPIITRRTNSRNFRIDRMRSIMIQALEQCGGTFLPTIEEPIMFEKLILGWSADRHLIFCDETKRNKSIYEVLCERGNESSAILVGPEGGFSPDEAKVLTELQNSSNVSLGPRILRAETAVISAISIWQSMRGDWG